MVPFLRGGGGGGVGGGGLYNSSGDANWLLRSVQHTEMSGKHGALLSWHNPAEAYCAQLTALV